jgi:hypothetical protein
MLNMHQRDLAILSLTQDVPGNIHPPLLPDTVSLPVRIDSEP